MVLNGLLVSLLPDFKGDAWSQCGISRVLLKRDAVEALEQLHPGIVEDWWDLEFRDHAGPEFPMGPR